MPQSRRAGDYRLTFDRLQAKAVGANAIPRVFALPLALLKFRPVANIQRPTTPSEEPRMDSQLPQLIVAQSAQDQLLMNQLQQLKLGLLSVSLLAIASLYYSVLLLHERGTVNDRFTVVTTEPILEHPISVTENDPAQIQFPVRFAENDATSLNITPQPLGIRITVPPMANTPPATPIEPDPTFPTAAAPRPGRRCDGMCL